MLKKYLLVVLTIAIVIAYVVIQKSPLVKEKELNAPTINFEAEGIQVSVYDDPIALMNGVSAYDEEDGDLTSKVQVESMGGFVMPGRRYVTYIVFDSDDNITKATRFIDYIDYKPPYFTLSDDLNGSKYSTTELLSKVHARSSVDGDISSKITIMNAAIVSSSLMNIKLSVTDSTNTSAYLSVNYYIEPDSLIKINLNKNLIYAKQGEVIDYYGNILNLVVGGTETAYLNPLVQIQIPEDMSQPGAYEIIYRIDYNGEVGTKRLIVVVEKGGE